MFSILVRLALSFFLVALALFLQSYWAKWADTTADYLGNFGVVAGLGLLCGIAAIVWTFGKRGFGLAVRGTMSVPLVAIMALSWPEALHETATVNIMAFWGSITLASAMLFIALWGYWPKKS